MTDQSPKILLVDSNTSNLEETKRLLELAGYLVSTSQSAAQGLEFARKHQPDLMLVDVNLPDRNAVEVCHQIKNSPDLQNTFVIMLSGSETDSVSSVDGLEAGADGYITRPISNRELIARMEALLRIRNTEAALRRVQIETQQLLEQSEVSRRALLSMLEDRQRADVEIQRRNAELTSLNQIGQALSKLAEPSAIFELVFEGIGKVLDNQNLYIALFDEDKQTISFPIYLIRGERIIGRERPLSNGITDYILHNNEPVFFTRDIAEGLEKLGINRIGIPSCSFLGVPMRVGEKVIGVIAVQDYEQEDAYEEHHLELLTTIAAQAAVALENARLYSYLQQELNERKQAEEALRKSEEQYRLLFESAPVGILSVTAEGQITEVNTAALRILGSPSAEMTKSINILTFPPLVEAGISADFQACIENGQAVSAEHPYRTKWGKSIFVKYQLTPVLSEAGKIKLVQGIIEDITEKKQAEAAMLESFARFRTLFEASPDAVMLIDPQGNWPILDCNTAACEMNGYTRDELIGQSIDLLNLKPGDNAERQNYLGEIERAGVMRLESFHRRKDGSIFPVDISTCMITLDERQAVLGIDRDITERKQAELALQKSEQRYRGLFEDSPIAVWEQDFSQVKTFLDSLKQQGVTDFKSYFEDYPEVVSKCVEMIRVLDVNLAGVKMYRAGNKEELIRQTQEELSPGEQEHLSEVLADIAEGKTSHGWDGKDTTMAGEPLDISLTWSVAPGHEEDFARVIVTTIDITERKQAERLLVESEKRYRTTLNNMMEGCQIIDHDWRYIYVNDTAAKQGRSTPESLLMHTMQEMYPGIETTDLFKVLQHCMEARLPQRIENEFRFSDGSSGWFELSIQPVPEGLFILSIDITERKQAEQILRESELRFSTVFHASPMSIAITRLRDNVLVDVNETWVNLTGYTREEVIAHPVTDLGLWIVSSQRVELIERLRAEGDVQGFEFQMRKKSGEVSDLLFAAVPIEVAGEACMLSMALDITERKHMEQALHESEERFRSLYNNATIGLYRTTPEGRILMCNPAAVRMLGFDSFDDLVKRNLEEEGFEPDYPRQEFRERMERDGMVIGLESKWFKKDGTSIFVRESATAVRDTQGKIVHYDGTFEDITEWKRAEEALRASEKKFKTLFEIAPVGISVLDQDMNILDANYALQRITGLKKKKLLNGSHRKRTYLRPDETAMPPEEFASSRAFQENMPIFDVETGIVTEDRGVVWTLVSAAPLDMPDASLVVITQDISDRKQTERAMRHRLAELETLYESGLSLNQLLEPREIGQKIIDVLSEKLDWNHTTVRLYHPESDELELLAYNIAGKTTKKEWKEIGERFKTLIARSGDGLSGWALKHGETVRCGDVLQDPRYKETVPGLRSGLYAPIMTGGRAIGVISVESEKPDYFTPEDEHLAVTLAAQAAVAFENIRLFKDLQASNDGLLRAYDKTIEGWSHALDLRDKETEGHTQRVTALTEDLARAMGIPEPDLIYIRWGALMHDIGKMGVPDRILLKPDKLSDDEWVIMRQHPVHAYNLISQIDFLKPALNIPHHHHERWDGSGYPEGLQGEQIPLEARIFAVIDVFDALTSDRPYRPAWPKDKAIQHIHEGSGKHFDPQVVDVFLNLIR